MRRLLLLAVIATALVAALAPSSSAAKPKPCHAYVKNWDNLYLHPSTAKCVTWLHSEWLECLIDAYDKNPRINALTCHKYRFAAIRALIDTKHLPRIQKRNRLIDMSGTLENYCSVDDPALCHDLETVEREIRKLQR